MSLKVSCRNLQIKPKFGDYQLTISCANKIFITMRGIQFAAFDL